MIIKRTVFFNQTTVLILIFQFRKQLKNYAIDVWFGVFIQILLAILEIHCHELKLSGNYNWQIGWLKLTGSYNWQNKAVEAYVLKLHCYQW